MTLDKDFIAHTHPERPLDQWHRLADHLNSTAALCESFCANFASGWGTLAGLWHDLGKYQPDFQKYLAASNENCTESRKSVPHSIVGAAWAWQNNLHPLSFVIAAHHGALKSREQLRNDIDSDPAARRRLASATPHFPEFVRKFSTPRIPPSPSALWLRFLFSALVDADSLDTEKYYTAKDRPQCATSIQDLTAKLETHLSGLNANTDATPVNLLRREVQQAARSSACHPPGQFRLTVPTGGGKTLATMLFALHHAATHGLNRVFVVIPYTSIIDQSVKVYREIFGESAVLEHHSNLDPEAESIENRVASENWDRPIVVTTSVQFLETLYANHKRKLRKLHRVANSVVVLDEVQTLPLELLLPIRHALNAISDSFRASIVYSTATQPVLLDKENAREIAPEPERLFQISRDRVKIQWPGAAAAPLSIPSLAHEISLEPSRQVLAIVNRRADAIDLATALGPSCIHLSALMCANHRRTVLDRIYQKLDAGVECLVVSTQLVEAGVDLDFPTVYRAMAGFDSLAQAAGRCNRNGTRSEIGVLKVFRLDTPEPRYLAQRTQVARRFLDGGPPDLFAPALYRDYFHDLVRSVDPDQKKVMPAERELNFPAANERFQLIDDAGAQPVVAPWGDWRAKVAAVRSARSAESLRALQPYTVSLYSGEVKKLREFGALEPLIPIHSDEEAQSWSVVPDRAHVVYSERFGFGQSYLGSAGLSLIVD